MKPSVVAIVTGLVAAAVGAMFCVAGILDVSPDPGIQRDWQLITLGLSTLTGGGGAAVVAAVKRKAGT